MKKQLKSLLCLAALGATVGFAPSVFAQAEVMPEGEIVGAGDNDVVGWNPSLAGTGTINMISNSNVIGQVEGFSLLLGFGITGGVDYVNGAHLWRNSLSVSQSWAKTPVLDSFVKNNDVIDFTTGYYYFFLDWAGAFAEVSATTSLLQAQAVTADPVTYEITGAGVNPGAPSTSTTDALKIADPFQPLTLTESIGVFAEPIQSDPLNISLRLGVGGRQTFADGVLIEKDNADTADVIEMQELGDVSQIGAEFFAGLTGKMQDGRLTYHAGGAVLFPFINNDPFERSAADLTRIALEAGATITVFDWMSVVYEGKYTIDPQLFPQGEELDQFQNSLLLTFTYTLVDRKEGIKKLKAEAAANAEKKAAEEAAKAKADAEKKAAEEEAAAQKAAADKKAEAERAAAEAEAAAAEAAAQKAAEEAAKAKEEAEKAKDAVPPKPE